MEEFNSSLWQGSLLLYFFLSWKFRISRPLLEWAKQPHKQEKHDIDTREIERLERGNGETRERYPRTSVPILALALVSCLCFGESHFRTEEAWVKRFPTAPRSNSACGSSSSQQAQRSSLKDCLQSKDHNIIYLICLWSVVLCSSQALQRSIGQNKYSEQGAQISFLLKLFVLPPDPQKSLKQWFSNFGAHHSCFTY